MLFFFVNHATRVARLLFYSCPQTEILKQANGFCDYVIHTPTQQEIICAMENIPRVRP